MRRVYPAGVVESSLAALGASARPQAPALAATGKGVSVALLDGPLDTAHPYLAGSTLTPWNAVTDGPREDDPTPDAARHATYMAGIIAGAGGPAGLGGVAPGAKILPVQVMAMDRGVLVGSTSSLLAGIDRALDPNGDGSLADHAQRHRRAGLRAVRRLRRHARGARGRRCRARRRARRRRSRQRRPDGCALRHGRHAGIGRLVARRRRDRRPRDAARRRRSSSTRAAQTQTLQAVPLAGMLAPIADAPVDVADLAGPSASDPDRAPRATRRAATMPGDYQSTDGTSRVTGKAVLIPRDGGAIGPRVVAAAAAGAKAVLLYGDGPIANGALGLDDRVAIPVAVLPGFAGTLLAKAVDAGRRRHGDASAQSIAPANAERRRRRRLLLDAASATAARSSPISSRRASPSRARSQAAATAP